MTIPPPRLRLRVSPAAEVRLKQGHPWLYESSLRDQNREGEAGELAVVYDRRDRFVAIGLYDPGSPLRLRVLHHGAPMTLDDAWWGHHLDAALSRRAGLFGPGTASPDTDGYRLVNGESDGWPGLVIDRYAQTLVIKLYTAAWFAHLPRVLELLDERYAGYRMVLRLSRNIMEPAETVGLYDGLLLRGELDGQTVTFSENGLRFEAEVISGQKTGFFLDQRENRARVGTLSGGRRVLNAFSFTGGFSLYAARGGATEVISLDISGHALRGAERNFALNAGDPNVAACTHTLLKADVFEWLERTSERYDLVVLDPPSLARRETERAGALSAYRQLAAAALACLRPGGVLMSASCSAHVSREEFYGAVREAAAASGRDWKEVATTTHAPDHHANFTEAEYLKAIYLREK